MTANKKGLRSKWAVGLSHKSIHLPESARWCTKRIVLIAWLEACVFDLSQYVFEMLRKDDEFILYRGRSKDDGSSRVLVVSPVTEYPAPEILEWQEHAY
jgi:hypothetical protein